MYAQWEGNSQIAKELLSSMLDSLDNKENLQVGLRCYGHRNHHLLKIAGILG